QVKPLIELAEGGLDTLSQQRTRAKALAGLIALVKSLGALERLAVLYTDNHDLALEVREAAAPQCQTQSLVIQVTPTIGAHIGPNAVGVAAVIQ
ncbi:MAG: DegV family protein, partial [Chloroflexota bacterium]